MEKNIFCLNKDEFFEIARLSNRADFGVDLPKGCRRFFRNEQFAEKFAGKFVGAFLHKPRRGFARTCFRRQTYRKIFAESRPRCCRRNRAYAP